MTLPTRALIEATFARREPTLLPAPPKIWQHACVALIFAGDARSPSLCFIRRAERDDDRWSGQMAFPGGRASPQDASAQAVAVRETMEEIGLTLAAEHLLGRLDDISLERHGGSHAPGVLSPFLFWAGEDFPALTLEPREVAQTYWIPVTTLYDTLSHTTYDWELASGQSATFPGITHEQEIIWGLSYRVLEKLGEAIGLTPLPPILLP